MGKCGRLLAGVRKLGSAGHSAKQSVDAFVEAVGQKDALQELQVGLRLWASLLRPEHSNGDEGLCLHATVQHPS